MFWLGLFSAVYFQVCLMTERLNVIQTYTSLPRFNICQTCFGRGCACGRQNFAFCHVEVGSNACCMPNFSVVGPTVFGDGLIWPNRVW